MSSSSRVGLARDAVLCRPRRRRVRLLAGLDGGRGCRIAASSAVSQSRVKSAWRDRSARDIEARQGQSNRRFGDLRGRLPGTWTERTAWKSACGEHHGATLGPPLAGTGSGSTSPSSGAATRKPTRDSVDGPRRGGKKAVLLERTKICVKGHMDLSACPTTLCVWRRLPCLRGSGP